MIRRTLIAAAPLVLFAAAASASEKKEEKQAVGQYVDLSPVALPIVVEGQLVNYVFAYVRINLTSGANSVKLREKEPFFRDALVRAGHRTPFTKAGDYMVLDAAKLSASLMREASAITGPGAVKSVVITSQSPQKRIPLPKAKTAA
jgi:flagellar basal body-associated protein FliL